MMDTLDRHKYFVIQDAIFDGFYNYLKSEIRENWDRKGNYIKLKNEK